MVHFFAPFRTTPDYFLVQCTKPSCVAPKTQAIKTGAGAVKAVNSGLRRTEPPIYRHFPNYKKLLYCLATSSTPPKYIYFPPNIFQGCFSSPGIGSWPVPLLQAGKATQYIVVSMKLAVCFGMVLEHCTWRPLPPPKVRPSPPRSFANQRPLLHGRHGKPGANLDGHLFAADKLP